MGGYSAARPFPDARQLIYLDVSPQALDMPRLTAWPGNGVKLDPGGLIEIEEGWDFAVLAELTRRGHRLAPVDGFARTVFGMGQIILRDPETGILTAGSEPRSDGCAVGW